MEDESWLRASFHQLRLKHGWIIQYMFIKCAVLCDCSATKEHMKIISIL